MRTALIAIRLASPALTSATELTGRELALLRIFIRRDFQSEVHNAHKLGDELRKERDFISAVLSTAGALVVVLDRQGRIVRFNRACEKLTGYFF